MNVNDEERIERKMEGMLVLYDYLRERAGLEKSIDLEVLGKIADEVNGYIQKNIDDVENTLEILNMVWQVVEKHVDSFRRGYYSLFAIGFLESLDIFPTDASVFQFFLMGYGKEEMLKEWLSKEERVVLEDEDGNPSEDFGMLIVLKYLADKYVEVIE